MVFGCRKGGEPHPTSSQQSTAAPSPPSSATSQPAPSAPASAEARPARQREEPSESGDGIEPNLGPLHDIGPAAPAAASQKGVVLIPRSDRPVLVAYPKGASTGALLDARALPDEGFAPFGRPPAVVGRFAYWVHEHKLLRRPSDGSGSLEVLAEDAQNATRVAASSAPTALPAVAYVARAKGSAPPTAKLWVDQRGTFELSPSGSAASSVALGGAGKTLLAVTLEGRSGMSPVHVRPIQLDAKRVELGEDRVAWVAGPAQATTEVTILSADRSRASILIPLERDITRFGLARVELGAAGAAPQVSWRDYPNGLEPAPVAAGPVCGSPAVAYVRPSEAVPHAPQELHLSWLSGQGLGPSRVIAHARKFSSVSLATLTDGAWFVYVADRRTWARRLTCPKPAKPAGARDQGSPEQGT